jgi:PleD family two-component response regulator
VILPKVQPKAPLQQQISISADTVDASASGQQLSKGGNLFLSVFFPAGRWIEPKKLLARGVDWEQLQQQQQQDQIRKETEKWESLHLCLCHLVGTNRPDFCLGKGMA